MGSNSQTESLEALAALVGLAVDGAKSQVNLTPKERAQKMREFVSIEPYGRFEVGDVVVKNQFGEERYKYPHKGDVCVVMDVFEEPYPDDNAHLVHGVVAVLNEDSRGKKNVIHPYSVDFRCYEKAGDQLV